MKNTSSFEDLCRWAEAETGIDLSGDRVARLREALDRVLSRQGIPAQAYLDRLPAQPEGASSLLERLTAELTVGETYFFRNEHHFRALREHVLPAILQDNAAKVTSQKPWERGAVAGGSLC